MKLSTAALMATCIFTASILHADGKESFHEARRLTQSGQILPLQDLLTVIQTEKQGSVLEVELEQRGSQYMYEIELLDEQGAVWEYKIDATTGKILERESED
jgi:uncharacterized membrane protein YkoI